MDTQEVRRLIRFHGGPHDGEEVEMLVPDDGWVTRGHDDDEYRYRVTGASFPAGRWHAYFQCADVRPEGTDDERMKPYLEGYRARQDGDQRWENPYPYKSQKHYEWDVGWTAKGSESV